MLSASLSSVASNTNHNYLPLKLDGFFPPLLSRGPPDKVPPSRFPPHKS